METLAAEPERRKVGRPKRENETATVRMDKETIERAKFVMFMRGGSVADYLTAMVKRKVDSDWQAERDKIKRETPG